MKQNMNCKHPPLTVAGRPRIRNWNEYHLHFAWTSSERSFNRTVERKSEEKSEIRIDRKRSQSVTFAAQLSGQQTATARRASAPAPAAIVFQVSTFISPLKHNKEEVSRSSSRSAETQQRERGPEPELPCDPTFLFKTHTLAVKLRKLVTKVIISAESPARAQKVFVKDRHEFEFQAPRWNVSPIGTTEPKLRSTGPIRVLNIERESRNGSDGSKKIVDQNPNAKGHRNVLLSYLTGYLKKFDVILFSRDFEEIYIVPFNWKFEVISYHILSNCINLREIIENVIRFALRTTADISAIPAGLAYHDETFATQHLTFSVPNADQHVRLYRTVSIAHAGRRRGQRTQSTTTYGRFRRFPEWEVDNQLVGTGRRSPSDTKAIFSYEERHFQGPASPRKSWRKTAEKKIQDSVHFCRICSTAGRRGRGREESALSGGSEEGLVFALTELSPVVFIRSAASSRPEADDHHGHTVSSSNDTYAETEVGLSNHKTNRQVRRIDHQRSDSVIRSRITRKSRFTVSPREMAEPFHISRSAIWKNFRVWILGSFRATSRRMQIFFVGENEFKTLNNCRAKMDCKRAAHRTWKPVLCPDNARHSLREEEQPRSKGSKLLKMNLFVTLHGKLVTSHGRFMVNCNPPWV
ncbi:unnamed protein product [Nesidiocoris tenuis]|uniref:Uncharacterized protein n=1 Tax=Nesidiocoris tenuis TaxID=355587 RepID=A0A6H5HN72_9HEMI|nr:unnamed protein product [Nesidiocoris tenuis]